jgi:type I restriction enzyme, R subunit
VADYDRLTAEQRARVKIDRQLAEAGWHVQHRKDQNLFAGDDATSGVAVREQVMAAGHGRADYLLYVDQHVVGVIEAKPEGTTLAGVQWQSTKYADGLRPEVRLKALTHHGRLPFVFEASGSETQFTNGYDPKPRARRIFHFPRPHALARIMRAASEDPSQPTWRAKVHHLPVLVTEALRPAQIEAINGLERALEEQRFDRSLVQMATGAGKTFTAVTLCYRLLRYGGFKRILFLVDRNNLGEQAANEFDQYRPPEGGQRFGDLYHVQSLTGTGLAASAAVVISTVQRVYAALRGENVPDGDDPEVDGAEPVDAVTVEYNAKLPPESFDLIIVDEAHRSIYNTWRGVVEYFDAHVVGLTATPGKHTLAFFQQNLVSEYSYPRSVADGVNVTFDVYRIQTEITAKGGTIPQGIVVPKRHRQTRAHRLERL